MKQLLHRGFWLNLVTNAMSLHQQELLIHFQLQHPAKIPFRCQEVMVMENPAREKVCVQQVQFFRDEQSGNSEQAQDGG